MGSDEKVIFVNATPQTAQSAPTLTFNLEDDHGSIEVITQVGPAATRHCGTKIPRLLLHGTFSEFAVFKEQL